MPFLNTTICYLNTPSLQLEHQESHTQHHFVCRKARANMQLMHEQLLGLKAEAGRTEELQRLCSQQQLDLEQLREKLAEWQSLASKPHKLE